jgi:hypothetical protein
MDKTKMRFFVNQTIISSKFGAYKNCVILNPIPNCPTSNANVGVIDNICEILVTNKHCIDVAEIFAPKGTNYNIHSSHMPLVVFQVTREFFGSNFVNSDGFHDVLFNLRTNFNKTVIEQNPYPIKNTENIYNKFITAIREPPPTLNGLPLDKIFKFSTTCACPIDKPKLISYSSKKDPNKMGSNDFLKTQEIIEGVFQCAILGFHKILILPAFGLYDENPQEDIIQIYNMCIYKYGHKFSKIIFSVHEDKKTFELYDKNIVRIQDLVREVDIKYDGAIDEAPVANDTDEHENLAKLLDEGNKKSSVDDLLKQLKTNVKRGKVLAK